MAELRFNPLINDWVMINSNRQLRPNTVSSDNKQEKKKCAFCPGEGNPDKIPAEGYDVLKYDNDFPALSQNPPPIIDAAGASKLYEAKEMYGKCEVILFSPDHDSSICEFTPQHIRKIINLWADRFEDIKKDEKIKYIFIFENRGELIGVTQPHPHGQIYGYSVIPKKIELEIDAFATYFNKTKNCMFCVLNKDEQEFGERIVYENDDFIVYVPYFAEYVYQIYIASKTHKSDITQFNDREKNNLALTFKMVTGMYDSLFDKKFPYMMCMHNAPVNSENADKFFHFHIEFYTALRDSSTQQFNASSETGVWAHCNPSSPEEKAGELREALKRFEEKIKV